MMMSRMFGSKATISLMVMSFAYGCNNEAPGMDGGGGESSGGRATGGRASGGRASGGKASGGGSATGGRASGGQLNAGGEASGGRASGGLGGVVGIGGSGGQLVGGAGGEFQSPMDVDLGMAADFVVLAKAGISTVPPSVIQGDIGVSPAAATSITGFSLVDDLSGRFSTSEQVDGRVYAADYVVPTPANMTIAVLDMGLAFADAASRAPDATEVGAGTIGGRTFGPGVYQWGTGLLLPEDVTLTGEADDVWIFQVAEDLTLSSNVDVVLEGGASPEHVYWQVAGKVELGTGSHFEGVVLTATSVAMATGASVNGRLFAQTAVTLDANTVVEPAQ